MAEQQVIRKDSKWRFKTTDAVIEVPCATENGVHFYWPEGSSEVFGRDSFLECFEPVEEETP